MGVANPILELATVLNRMRQSQVVYLAVKRSMQRCEATKAQVLHAKLAMQAVEADSMAVANEIAKHPHLHDLDVVTLARLAGKMWKAQQDYLTYYSSTCLKEVRRIEPELDRRIDEILGGSVLGSSCLVPGQQSTTTKGNL